MRRISLWVLSTVTGLLLLFSYRTSTMGQPLTPGTTVVADNATPAGTAVAGDGDGTYNGSVAQTRWGPVQVRIVVSGGTITSVTTVQVPSGNSRDREINARAVPILTREALAVQSADIDTVSGATVTSVGYRDSLQAAIDAAHLG